MEKLQDKPGSLGRAQSHPLASAPSSSQLHSFLSPFLLHIPLQLVISAMNVRSFPMLLSLASLALGLLTWSFWLCIQRRNGFVQSVTSCAQCLVMCVCSQTYYILLDHVQWLSPGGLWAGREGGGRTGRRGRRESVVRMCETRMKVKTVITTNTANLKKNLPSHHCPNNVTQQLTV